MPSSTILSSIASESTGFVSKRSSNVICSNGATKRQRASVSTREFIPPDVSGLSKREGRLVKNCAAAFLSRQRKREEFELKEMYVVSNEPGYLVKN
jgi:hypothetical protein